MAVLTDIQPTILNDLLKFSTQLRLKEKFAKFAKFAIYIYIYIYTCNIYIYILTCKFVILKKAIDERFAM